MTSVPSNPPYPIILNVDQYGNPVRLAEANAIFVSSIVAISVSAASYGGLSNSVNGAPGGLEESVQINKGDGTHIGYPEFTYDEAAQKLSIQNINVAQNSILNDVTATNLSSVTVSSDTATINTATINTITTDTLTATSLSSTTVCGVNSILSSIITNSLLTTNVTATTISATNWINYPSPNNTSAIWAASSIAGYPVSANSPGAYSILVFLDGKWVASAVPTGAGGANPAGDTYYLQFKNGILLSALDTAQYDPTISGVRARGISATTYYNLPNDVSNSLNSHIASAVHWELSTLDNRYLNASGDTASTARFIFSSVSISSLHASSYSNLPSGSPFWNADRLRGTAISQTTPAGNNVLVYDGAVWTPSGSISLGTISATNLGATNIVGSRVNVTDISSVTVSAETYLNLPQTNASSLMGFAISSLTPSAGQALVYSNAAAAWAPGYRIFQSSAAPSNLEGFEGDIFLQYNAANAFAQASGLTNASAILGEQISPKEASGADTVFSGTDFGLVVYSYATSAYTTLRADGTTLNGNRDYSFASWPLAQGSIVASFLGSASEYFQINPAWNSVGLLQLSALPGYEYPGYPDIPQDKDVLVFNENLYGKQILPIGAISRDYKAWTWERLSLRDGYLYDVNVEDAAVNNILRYDGSSWVDSTSATLTTVSATSATFANVSATNSKFSSVSVSQSLLASSVSATVYRGLPLRYSASSLHTHPLFFSEPITASSLLTFYDGVWQNTKDISVNSISGVTAKFDNLTTERLITTRSNVGNISNSSVTLNLTNSQNFEITLSSSLTSIDIVNPDPLPLLVEEFLLFIKYNSNIVRTIAWVPPEAPSIYMNWPAGSPPSLTCATGRLDIFRFITFDGGINWYASIVGQNYTTQ